MKKFWSDDKCVCCSEIFSINIKFPWDLFSCVLSVCLMNNRPKTLKYHLNQHVHVADWFWAHYSFFSHLYQPDIWVVGNQLCLLPNERPKKLVYDFKVSLARLWHGTLQRERKITLHTWSIKKPLKWIAGWDPVWHKSWHWWHSPWVWGYLAWTRWLLGLYQWALAHPMGAPKPCRLKKNWWGWQHIWACNGFYFSQPWCYRLQSPAQQHQWGWPR